MFMTRAEAETTLARAGFRAPSIDDHSICGSVVEKQIKDVVGDSSASKVNDARSAISDIERFVRDLDNVKRSDKKANSITSQWPDYIRSFAPAATALVGLKKTQFALDAAPGKCEASTLKLVAALKKFVDDKNPDGLLDGPKLAEEEVTSTPGRSQEWKPGVRRCVAWSRPLPGSTPATIAGRR